jgi:hypothetical protein
MPFSWSKRAIKLFRVLSMLAVYDAVVPPALAQVHFPRVSPSHNLVTVTPGAGNTQVQFGDGTLGQAPPVGANNVTGTYRVGNGTGKVPRHRH